LSIEGLHSAWGEFWQTPALMNSVDGYDAQASYTLFTGDISS